MKRHLLGIYVILGSALLLLSPLTAQSLGDVARASKASKKPSRVVTNDTLPEAKGPANGAAAMAIPKADLEDALPTEEEPNRGSAKTGAASAATGSDKADREKELREQVNFLNGQIATLNTKMEAETNEATRDAMQHLAATYQQQRQDSQKQLDELMTAKKNKPVK
jgi:hypothetical protein